ncbi:MAG TPA: ChaN family lipoprotein [Kofleriaceae bacterium]|nr:ChaN family lipoprotein [Kofleriaceae bacterium]
MISSKSLALAAALTTTACGGRYPTPPPAKPGTAASEVGVRGVEAAALPFELLRARGGQELETAAAFAELGAAQVICIGETHDNPHHHWAQLQIIDALSARPGRPVALAMEMFQRPFQGVLDDYAAGRIDAGALQSRSGWQERWGYDFDLYRPMIDLVVARGGTLLAANVSTELRKKISKDGLEALTPEERARVPELVLDDPAHRAWWDDIMADMAGHHGSPHGEAHGKQADSKAEPTEAQQATAAAEKALRAERMYQTQVLWDETMADTAARWVLAAPDRLVIILAGNGHCHDAGIVGRLRRRGVERAVSVTPIIDNGKGNVAAQLAEPVNDYLFVMSYPRPAQAR